MSGRDFYGTFDLIGKFTGIESLLRSTIQSQSFFRTGWLLSTLAG
jgi:hypothetical protein